MSESITIHVPVQVEYFSDQFVRGRPLGPWRLQAVGTSPSEVLKQLSKLLTKRLSETLPTDLFAGGLPAECQSWKCSVDLPPQGDDTSWEVPLQIELDCFRWQLANGHNLVRVPAVNCTLFGKPPDLDDAEIAKQARVALLRLAENQGLLALSQRFTRRSYEMHHVALAMPLGGEPERDDRKREERKKTSALRAAASDLCKAKLAEIYGLDEKVTELADHLIGDAPQSVLLVGPAGVGKTSLLYRLVQMSSSLGLGDRRYWSTSGARIVSGMSGLGMWQQRCSKLIRQAHATKSILHLGSLFELLEAGKIDGQPGVASMVRQSIARGKLLAIAECTPEQLSIIEREDPMLLRAFTRMEFKELAQAKIRAILRSATQHGKSLQQVDYSDQAIEELVRLHSRFATYSALPATALQLMRTISDRESPGTLVEADQVARAFAQQTGLPRFLVDDSVPLNLTAIGEQLSGQVVGQPEPVELVVDLLATLKARLVRPGRPLASLMFIGPTGVGKTEMAKAIAQLLYSDTSRMIRIDMSEYASPWSAVKLIGKAGEGDGTLTSPIREQPFSVVLLDEFEKADPNVFDLLLQLLGEGRLTDSQGRLADFRNAVVIMTSNLGAETFRGGGVGFGEGELATWREHFEREVRRFVRPEFLGRLDRIVPFRPLSMEVVKQIAYRELEKLRQRPGLKYSDCDVAFDDSAVDRLCQLGYQPKYGARPLRRAIERNVAVPLADALSSIHGDDTWSFVVAERQGDIVVQAKKLATKTKSHRQLEIDVIDTWQQLGRMARTARVSGPVRDLENELERTQRQNESLEKRLRRAQGPSRTSSIRLQIQQGQAFIEISRKIRDQLLETTERIGRSQLSLMTAWQKGAKLDWQNWQNLSKSELTLLRQATEDVVRRRVSGSNVMSLVVVGRGEMQLETLLKAYRQLAEQNHWTCEAHVLHEYDARHDESSTEFRKQSLSRDGADKSQGVQQPSFRLFAPAEITGESGEPVVDAYRLDKDLLLKSAWPNPLGLSLQFQGLGVESWVEGEGGVVHFYDPAATGSRRRQRFRILAFPQRLAAVHLPLDWLEPVAANLPDPRRVVDLAAQRITSSSDVDSLFSQGKVHEGLFANMQLEHERALWQSIGYVAIPRAATLDGIHDMDIPF
ncbi:MAG: AAA family ATPase [Pirellulaceae bacterium]